MEITRINIYIYNDVVVMDLVDCLIFVTAVLWESASDAYNGVPSGQIINFMMANAKAVVPPAGNTAAALKSQNSVL